MIDRQIEKLGKVHRHNILSMSSCRKFYPTGPGIVEKWTDGQMDGRVHEAATTHTHTHTHTHIYTRVYIPVYIYYYYYSKFAKDNFFLVKYFCILRKLHKYFCVS